MAYTKDVIKHQVDKVKNKEIPQPPPATKATREEVENVKEDLNRRQGQIGQALKKDLSHKTRNRLYDEDARIQKAQVKDRPRK